MENHQVKSRWYYLFWGAATVTVLAGQLYVGTGYRQMAREQRAFSQAIYDAQMGWDAQQKAIEAFSNRKLNRTGEFE